MLEIIVSVLILIILWYIAFDCNKKLSQNLSKQSILIFTAFVQVFIMIIYAYFNIEHCYDHIPLLNRELIFLIILVPFIALVTNMMLMHAPMPKIL